MWLLAVLCISYFLTMTTVGGNLLGLLISRSLYIGILSPIIFVVVGLCYFLLNSEAWRERESNNFLLGLLVGMWGMIWNESRTCHKSFSRLYERKWCSFKIKEKINILYALYDWHLERENSPSSIDLPNGYPCYENYTDEQLSAEFKEHLRVAVAWAKLNSFNEVYLTAEFTEIGVAAVALDYKKMKDERRKVS